ncbi:MAG: bifunctional proline dehydrogenase/L-glutamate gamma-semialdehyde dehydrogenase, partial [Anaerolineae bacterium]
MINSPETTPLQEKNVVDGPPPANLDPKVLAEKAIKLAADLHTVAKSNQNRSEKAQATQLSGMMADPVGKTMTMNLSDQAFRSHIPRRVNDQIRHLIDGYGVPSYLSWWEQVAMELGTQVGRVVPGMVVPMIVAKLRAETSNVIIPAENRPLRKYLQSRKEMGTRLNLNYLGEAIVGEREAKKRLNQYMELISWPDIEYISVKISAVFSQINLIGYDKTIEKIKDRLRPLYREANKHSYTRQDGSVAPKFINLDMEEYRDLHLTIAVFEQLLEEPEFHQTQAGIVLQAYLPDSHAAQIGLTDWAIDRVAKGNAPIKVRIVKGANLAMEKVEADMHGWEQAPYYTKADVDANYKRMVLYGCQPENAQAVRLGIASHNLFDIAFALTVRAETGVEEYVEFEMLEGMANHQARAVQKEADGLLLYAPAVAKEDFHSAISYLVRRLDENTAPENFLHDLFDLEIDNEVWERQKQFFLSAVERFNEVSMVPNRTQNRLTENIIYDAEDHFENEADTDFSLPENRDWINQVVAKWRVFEPEPIPLQIGGYERSPNFDGRGTDPSRPELKPAYTYALARPEQVEAALTIAVDSQDGWVNAGIEKRKTLLIKAAESLAKRRGDLIGAAIFDGGKAVDQADVEVTEAIDFANYYSRSFDPLADQLNTHEFKPFGTVLVAPPWNFPIAIPCGGILSALMAGNTVIFKPAPEAVLVGWELAKALWAAGIPKNVLQFVPTTDDEVGRSLVTDKRVNAVILTGGYETAQMFLGWKPDMRLLAETSGKNSLIISGMADHDLAIKDLVFSAFGHNGQKCSAASLAILEDEVYDNPAFMRQLKDAAASLTVGSAWNLSNKVTPQVQEPSPALHRALTRLDEGESWLLEPKMVDGNPRLWSPGIKIGVKPGSFYHKTECFGPVLGIMRAESVEEAVKIVNQSEFGLTTGFHSLDDREIAYWREHIQAGNAYINRGTTGAIVERQPFGGWKKSVFGNGAKAGGPNYVAGLGSWWPKSNSLDVNSAKASYKKWWDTYFSQEHDPSGLIGESNHSRYVP